MKPVTPNDVRKLILLAKALGFGRVDAMPVFSMEILHEDECPRLTGGDCTCDCEVRPAGPTPAVG